jgi:hypothetical protein
MNMASMEEYRPIEEELGMSGGGAQHNQTIKIWNKQKQC